MIFFSHFNDRDFGTFFGSLFGSGGDDQYLISLPPERIESVPKKRNLFFDNSLQIELVDKTEVFLTSFLNRYEAFDSIQLAMRPHKRKNCGICKAFFYPIPDEQGFYSYNVAMEKT